MITLRKYIPQYHLMIRRIIPLMLALCFGLAGCSSDNGAHVKNLRVEMKENPLGIDSAHPRFSWQVSSDRPDLVQTTYRIQVAASPEALAAEGPLMWDSGTVASDASVLVPYEGEPLASGQYYWWRVKLSTNQGDTQWSEPGSWSMALDDSEWTASWIGEDAISNPGESAGSDKDAMTRLAARYLRKEFSADKTVSRAMLYISGLGVYEAYLNGEKIGDDVLAPGLSQYDKRVYYNVYDVTEMLASGKNTLGVILGNGRYFAMRWKSMQNLKTFGLPSLLAQLNIEYSDGTKAVVASDGSWKVNSRGPIVANNEFDGEEYDARLEFEGWDKNGFDDSGWKTVDMMDAPKGRLSAQQNPNIRIQETIKPVAIFERPDGKYILDMGQNMVGWLKVSLKGKAGQPITMRFAEILQDDGSLYVDNLRSAKATDIYIPARDGEFSWHPLFVFHGFRFVEISGLDYKPELSAFTGEVLYDAMETTGSFETSNPLVNQIHKNAYWGIRGNYRGMPTDCPQRDERMGWLGDRTTGAYGEAYIFDNALLYNKWVRDIEESMSPEGAISDVSPNYWPLYTDNVTWPAAFFNVSDMLYRHFGDDSAIRSHYPAMKRWMDYTARKTMKDYIMTKDLYGDWCMPPESQELIHSQDPSRITDGAILSTTVYYDLLNKMAEFAAISGHEEDIEGYRTLAAKIREAYNERFFDEETARYGNNTVTANILSLRLGLVPEGYEQRVFDNIVNKTEVDFNGHVSTGVLGIQHLMRGLTEYGRVDLAYKILTNETYPSWGYMVRQGATTIWELWNGDTADPAMNSGNHVMLLGDLIIWLYEDLAGIKCAPEATGFKKIVMEPVFPEGLDEVSASYDSVYGTIESAWSRKNGRFSWTVTVPGNTSAVVRIPKAFNVSVKEKPGIHSITDAGEYVEVEIGSGKYNFK